MAQAKKKSYTLLIVLMSIAAVLAIALSVAGTLLKTMANTYLGKGKPSIVTIEGSENWDTDYYSPSYANDKAAAVANGEAVTKKLCDEGFVLLKNRNNALPLNASSTTVSLIGRGAAEPLYGGSGSGNVDASKAASPYSGIRQAGFTMDDASYDYFNAQKGNYTRCSIKMDDYNGSQWLIGEVAYTDTTGAQKPFTVTSGNVAVYVIARAGGEGWDLSNNLKRDAAQSTTFAQAVASGTGKAEYDTYWDGQHQLELSQYEKNWLAFCKANYAKTVVVINSSNAMELGELENDNGVDAVVWVGGPGSTGFNSLGDILAGKVNPSGRTVDIYPADFTAAPTFLNSGEAVQYTDIGAGDVSNGNANLAQAYTTQYEEGIYIGYRYYETAAQEGFINYDQAVVYPFGYGLSYTTFEKTATWTDNADSVTATVTVKNTGNVAGKEVVQLYYSAPYTEGGIEKSAVVLGDFAKTKLLQPNETDTLTLTVSKKDMASYDYKGVKVQGGGYVFEKGEYTFTLRENSHEVSVGEDKTHTVNYTADLLFTENQTVEDGDMLLEKQAARNRFNDVSAMFKDTKTSGYATLMKRSDFAGTYPTAPTEADQKAKNISLTYTENGKEVTKTVAEFLKPFDASKQLLQENATMPKVGAQNGIVLSNLRGLSYNDRLWNDFLDQLTESDYTNANAVLINAAYNTGAVESLGKPATEDLDGPQGFSSLWGSTGCCAYCSEVIIASTFNKDLAYEMGKAIGEEALVKENDTNGWYGPAMNIHRSPFAGRNFEYYSEDPVMSGKIACAVVEGAADKGCYAYLKHYALNDSEVMRTTNLCTWADEQTIREIYLKPFQYVIENATTQMKYISDTEGTISTRTMPACTAIMSAFNRVGGTWAGGSVALMKEVLRDEWGFRGLVLSDFNLYDYMDSDQGIRAGTNLQLTWSNNKPNYADTSNATTRQAIRQAYKDMCYTVVNSNRMQGVAPGSIVKYGLAWWQIAIILIDVAAGLFVLGGIIYIVYDKKKRNPSA
ncbi:MAG: glycoside hydrolase family 3 protein [Clostridia bacterium]|nr:glycoside hydrolase family 3 protein [Clostridia bacterium]